MMYVCTNNLGITGKLFRGLCAAATLCLILSSVSGSARAEDAYWAGVGQQIIQQIDQAESLYKAGDATAAKRAVIQAYFGEFESRKMEAAMRIELGIKHTYQVEKLFGDLRKAITSNADSSEISAVAEAIRVAITHDALLLDKAGITPDVFEVNQ